MLDSISRRFRRRVSDFPGRSGSARSRSRETHEIQIGGIMKYFLLIAAMMTLTSATSISSSDADCCGGGACCPGGCCMMMTR